MIDITAFEIDGFVSYFANKFDKIDKEETKKIYYYRKNFYPIFFWFSGMLKFQIIGVHWYCLLNHFLSVVSETGIKIFFIEALLSIALIFQKIQALNS